MQTVTRWNIFSENVRNRAKKGYKEYLKLSKNIKEYYAVESDSLCGEICDMHTFGKYAKCAPIARTPKTDMPNFNCLLSVLCQEQCLIH